MQENWQKADQLTEQQKIQICNLCSGYSEKNIVQWIELVLFAGVSLISFLSGVWHMCIIFLVLLAITGFLILRYKKNLKLLAEDVTKNQFEFMIEEARHIDEKEHINGRKNEHHGSISLTDDVIFIRSEHVKQLHSFTIHAQNADAGRNLTKNMQRINTLDWHNGFDFEKPDGIYLEEILKKTLLETDGVWLPACKKAFSAKEYLEKHIKFGKNTVFWYYADQKKREKNFPKDFQWKFAVIEGKHYIEESDDDGTTTVQIHSYASGLNCPPTSVSVGKIGILIRRASGMEVIKIWPLMFEE